MIVNNKTGITLSGGGFKGLAHLGILQYLDELGVEINEISGASAGALVGAFIAEGYKPLEIMEFTKTEKFFSRNNFSARNGGIFNTDVFEKVIKKYIPHNSFKNLKIPLHVAVTDLTNAKSLIFNEGDLAFAIKASCCFPLVFQPVLFQDDIYLCDGGLLNNFPIEQIKTTCRTTIGVNISPLERTNAKFGYKDLINRIISITTSTIKNNTTELCDIYLCPEEISKFGIFDVNKIDEIYQFGYQYAKKFEQEFKSIKKKSLVI